MGTALPDAFRVNYRAAGLEGAVSLGVEAPGTFNFPSLKTGSLGPLSLRVGA